ncbi:MAG: ArsR/SmtB family transcription factor [Planctomycetota bacterium]|jgi:ArsR family transcriptional regulator
MARKKNSKGMTTEALGQVAARFKVLSEPARLSLLNALMKDEANVGELVETTGLSQANVSKHLKVLQDAGYVQRHKDGLFHIYSIADSSVWQLCDLMCTSIEAKLGRDLKNLR